MPDFPLPNSSHYSVLDPVQISEDNFEEDGQNGHYSSGHHIFNRKIISLTEVYSLFCPYSFNLFEREW